MPLVTYLVIHHLDLTPPEPVLYQNTEFADFGELFIGFLNKHMADVKAAEGNTTLVHLPNVVNPEQAILLLFRTDSACLLFCFFPINLKIPNSNIPPSTGHNSFFLSDHSLRWYSRFPKMSNIPNILNLGLFPIFCDRI
jgi:hypothetical protein